MAPDIHLPTVFVPRSVVAMTWDGLRLRSGSRRESACVWVGERYPDHSAVTNVLFPEDFGPVDSGELHHVASREALDRMFDELRRTAKQIIADVHTHPRSNTNLSPTDRAHPIEYRVGLLAIVIPHYATRGPVLATAGVHAYGAGGKWRRVSEDEAASTLIVRDE